MSDLPKVASLPQFNWYNKWTLLETYGKDGLKQPD
jgi:hypothetical protein